MLGLGLCIAGSGIVSMWMAKLLPNVYSLRADANLTEILVAASECLVFNDTEYEFEVRRHALLRDCLKAVDRKAFHPTKKIKVSEYDIMVSILHMKLSVRNFICLHVTLGISHSIYHT